MQHDWIDEDIEYIRLHYTGCNCMDMAQHFNVSYPAMRAVIHRFGLGRLRKGWTEEEDERLMDLLGRYNIRTVAKKMHRGLNAVVSHAKAQHMTRRMRDGWFTKQEVCQILGVDHSGIDKYIKRGDIRATWHNGNTCHISQGELIRFLKRHAIELKGHTVDLYTIIMLMSPTRLGTALQEIEREQNARRTTPEGNLL